MTEATEKSILSNKFGEVVARVLLGRVHRKQRKNRKQDKHNPAPQKVTVKISGVTGKEEALGVLRNIVRDG